MMNGGRIGSGWTSTSKGKAMDRVKIVNGVTLLDKCRMENQSFKKALLLARSRLIITTIHDGKRYCSPYLDVKSAIDANKDFIEQQYRLRYEGRSY